MNKPPPLYREAPEGSCVFIYSVHENRTYLHVMKRVDLEQIIMKKKIAKASKGLPHPVTEIQVGTQLQLSLHHPDGTNAYSSATSWLVMKAVPKVPFQTQEAIDDAVESLAELADAMVSRRVNTQAKVVNLEPAGLHKPDKKLSADDLMAMTADPVDDDDDFEDEELV